MGCAVISAATIASAQEWNCSQGLNACKTNGFMEPQNCDAAYRYCMKTGHWWGMREVIKGRFVPTKDHGAYRKE